MKMKWHKKNYKRSKKELFNKKSKAINKKKPQNVDRRRRNYKYMQRSKEAEETQRRQKIIEDKYRNEFKKEESTDSEVEIAENPIEQLLSSLNENKNTEQVIESSTEDENELLEDDEEDIGDEEEDDSDEDMLDNVEVDVEGEEDDDEDKDEESKNNIVDGDKSVNNETVTNVEDVILDEEFDEEIENNSKKAANSKLNQFSQHFECELHPESVENLLTQSPNIQRTKFNWPHMGNIQVEIPVLQTKFEANKKKTLLGDDVTYVIESTPPELITVDSIEAAQKCCIKVQLQSNIEIANKCNLPLLNKSKLLTPLQGELFSIINKYLDLYFSNRLLDNAEEIRFVYCLHVLNHALKTRTKILHHNAKLSNTCKKQKNSITPDVCRDQGLVRPKVLIVVPFRDSAFRVVNNLIKLLFGEDNENAKQNGSVINYKRFEEEYTGESIQFPRKNPKPEDYERLFAGNTDDNFRIGISLTRKCIKLYTEFYSSDIVLASPLGLRMIIGAPGDDERDYDFLASIEILILDQAELFFAQNWEHVLHLLDHLHLQPQSTRGTDYSRVRFWSLNGYSKFYRQNLLFTSHEIPEFRSIYNNRFTNYAGKVRLTNPIFQGSIRHVTVPISQVFHKVKVQSLETMFDTRFTYFINEILPQYKNPSMSHCMIYVPSYFDYVRLRNYFKTENINFVQVCEYTKDAKVARARDMFYHSSAHFMLYSERAHFFKRTRIKGIRHLVMYQPPNWPHFYPEMINLMQDDKQNPRDGLEQSMTVTVLYTKYDIMQVSSIIGTENAANIFNSNKITHLFTSAG